MHMVLRPSALHRDGIGAESIREVVFGVEDGVVQNMVLIAGMVGAGLSNTVILIAAVINAMAGVLSMSMGTYLSSKAERDVGLANHIRAGAPATRSPQRDAAVMAGAYAVGATVPVIPFIGDVLSRTAAVSLALVLAGLALFLLGVLKASLSGQSRLRSGFEMLVLASAAGLTGYLLGVAARAIFGLDV